ncbi:TcdA/TcdB pore-forming domain-containing protein [Pseudomonas alvandae]|uniref:TcdA/TcdB pore-forming domain-containing protein n=1 Tax=Pseudomonas canavaninivorans TaxID=2842348 RepID=UPI002B1E793C|nr:TcdA/TcdB pore-forming domain-containing protein [Pseudomonas canavaninivorans]
MSETQSLSVDNYVDFVDLLKLKEIDQLLVPYQGTPEYEAVHRYYASCVALRDSAQLLEPLGLLKQALGDLQGRSRVRRTPTEPDSSGAAGLTEIYNKLEGFEARLYNNIERLPATAVPKKLNFVWLGGGLGDIQLDYLRIWKRVMPDDYAINVWYDKDGLLAHETTRIIVEAAKADTWLNEAGAITSSDSLADHYEARVTALKRQMYMHVNRALKQNKSADEARIDLLVRGYGCDGNVLRALKDKNAHIMRSLDREGLRLRNINELQTYSRLEEFYNREMSLRGNLAAASDIVRLLVEHDEGGVYSDVDFLPSFVQEIAGINANQLVKGARLGVLQLLLNNNPQWMPGRQALVGRYTDYTSHIPVEHREMLERFAKGSPSLDQVFAPFQETSVPTDSLRLAFIEGGESNALIVSHPRSAPLETILQRIETHYQALLAVEREAARANDVFHGVDLMKILKDEFGIVDLKAGNEDYRAMSLYKGIVDYFSDGIRPGTEGSIFLTGPGALRAGLLEYESRVYTPSGANAVRNSIRLETGFSNVTEEDQDHSWKENASPEQWLEKEKGNWLGGRFQARYAKDIEPLLKYNSLEFDSGWPVIEGRHLLSTDLLQHLADELGEPFMQAMNNGHDGVLTFDKVIPLGFDDRQTILAENPSMLPPGSLSDPRTQQWSVGELLNRFADGRVSVDQLSPLQRVQLGPLIGAQALDNRSFEAARPNLIKLAENFSKLGTAGGYAMIERALYQYKAPVFMAGLARAATYSPERGETALKLKKAALEQRLTLRQWGWHVGRVKQLADLENNTRVNERVETVLNGLDYGGMKVAPQDLLLWGDGERLGGRCYPLALVMAAALSGEQTAVRSLFNRFYLAIDDREASDSATFLSSLESLRDVQVSEVGEALARSSLQEVVTVLQSRTTTATLMLNSDNHSMLAAKVFEGERSTYHFYDPNFGLFVFDDSTQFHLALEQFFVEQKMAIDYAAYGDAGHPTFDLIELEGARVSSVALPGEMTVAQLVRPEALPGQPVRPIRQRIASARGQSLQSNPRLGSSLLALDSHWWAQQISETTNDLHQANNLGAQLVPLFDTLEDVPGGGYRITLIDPANPAQLMRISTDDHRFLRIKNYLSERFSTLANHDVISRDPTAVGAVHTLNAGFAIQALMSALRAREGDGRSLTLAVRLHAYVNYTQMAHGVITDIAALVGLVRQALAEEKLIAQAVAPVVKASVGGRIGEGVGALLQLANVGFDIYQLSTARNDVERAEFGTQLAFDSASLAVAVAAYAAGATAGAILGGAAVILGGLAVGVAAVVRGFATIAEEAEQVGLFFLDVEKAHLDAYRFDAAHNAWTPGPSLIIETVDLANCALGLGSPKLYPLHDHFGVPTFEADYARAINIRQQLELPSRIKFAPASGQAIVLPCTPQTCYGYAYKALPFSSWHLPPGFDTARRLQKIKPDGGWLFLCSFYSFPCDHILHRLHSPDYRPTTIDVLLDSIDRSLVVPVLLPSWHGKINYRIRGAGKRCAVLINTGVSLSLEAPAQLTSSWVLDAPWAKESDVRFEGIAKLFIRDVAVSLTGAGHHGTLLRLCDDQMFKVEAGQLSAVELTEAPGMDQQALHAHMKTLARQHRLAMPYTAIHDYLVPFEKPDEPRHVTAWYDGMNDRFLYIRDEIPGADETILGAVTGGYAWFYDPENVLVWQVDATTGVLVRRYWLWRSFSEFGVIKSLEADEQGVIHIVQQISRQGRVYQELGYVIHAGELLLISATRDVDTALEPAISTHEKLRAWPDVLGDYYDYPPSFADQYTYENVDWKPAPFVSVCWKNNDLNRDMAWIRRSDRLIIRPSLEPEYSRGWPDSIKNLTDLMLITPTDESDSFVIYNRLTQRLCHLQRTLVTGKGQWTVRWLPSDNLKDVIAVEGGYVAMRTDGLFFNLAPQGELQFAGLNETWFKGRNHWLSELAPLTSQYKTKRFAIVGLTNTRGDANLCAWYVDDKLLLCDLGQGKEVRLLNVTPDGEAAWLFDVSNGGVYRQAFVDPQKWAGAFGQGVRLLQADAIPAAEREWASCQFAELTVEGPGLKGITHEGLVVILRDHEPAMITGVTHEWVVAQGDQVLEALGQLASHPFHSALLTVEEPDSLTWFIAGAGQMIRVLKTAIPPSFEILGTQRQTNVLLHEGEQQKLLTLPQAQQVSTLSYARREGEVLVVEGNETRVLDLLPLIPDGVATLVLRIGQGAVSYRLSKAAWLRINSVILDCRHSLAGVPATAGKLSWELDEPDELLLSRVDKHLVLIDPNSGHSLICRDAYATDSDFHGEVLLNFGRKGRYKVSTLVGWLGTSPKAQGDTTLKALLEVSSELETNEVS